MNRFSVRARLTLWNVGIVALILITLGIGVRTIVHTSLMTGIDRELTERAERIRDDSSRRIRFEKGQFIWLGRPRGDKEPRKYPIDGTPPKEEDKKPNATPDDSPRPTSGPPSPTPPPDAFAPRLLTRNGDPVGFFRSPAWDKGSLEASSRTHKIVLKYVIADEERYRIVTVPVKVKTDGKTFTPDTEPAFVQLAFRLTDIDRGLSALDNALLTLLPLSLLVSGLGGAWLTGRALRPVREITLATDRIAAESLSGRLPVSGNDEFSELSRRFNQMLERLESAFERQRRFVADASHELRTPLAIVTANTSLALDDETTTTPEGSRRAFLAIHGAAGRMSRIVGDLLLLAQSDSGILPRENRPVPIASVLQTATEEAQAAYRERTGQSGATIMPPEPTTAVVENADRHFLVRVFVNLIDNALRYTPQDGCIALTIEVDNGSLHILVADTGSGIAPEHLPRLFDRFYRADAGRDRGRGGTGLGLAIVQTLVHSHNGIVTIDSEPGRGTVVSVTLPTK
ncbi:MAG: HAMP domain-containing histidine kinase [Fibrella sp.]|nr:HAMP domain-containing histidine kinase [Armatimonadota bacterium]